MRTNSYSRMIGQVRGARTPIIQGQSLTKLRIFGSPRTYYYFIPITKFPRTGVSNVGIQGVLRRLPGIIDQRVVFAVYVHHRI